jgi:hypothetical protein
MTERWRKKLGDLDNQGPSDDVFERAKEGPTRADEPLPGMRPSKRVITIVVAFAIFALGISAFAIPALRMNDAAPRGGAGATLMPLWPSQSPDQLDALQTSADAGSADWALSPQGVAAKFGQDVMGWPDAVAQRNAEPHCYVQQGASSSPVQCSSLPVGGFSVPAGVPPDLAQATPSANVGPVTWLALYECTACVNASPSEWIQVYQPLNQGPGGIWAVLQAQGEASVSVTVGQVVHDGASVSGTFYGVGNGSVVPTFGYGSCALGVASSTFHAPAESGVAAIQIDVQLSGCEGAQPGYVWAAFATSSLAGPESARLDPITAGAQSGTLASLTAASVTMIFPDGGVVAASTVTEPTTAVSPSAVAPVTWSSYSDPMGFTIDLPSDWGKTSIQDELVMSAPSGEPYVQINRVDARPRDDSSFPLDYSSMASDPQAHFYSGGQTFIIQWLTGSAAPPTAADTADFKRITESISFPPWTPGDVRNGWTSVGKVLPSASAEWITFGGDHYVASYGPPRALLGPGPACPSATYEIRETGVAVATCGNGDSGSWDYTTGASGFPGATFRNDLATHPAVLSWDGQLLVLLPGSESLSPVPTVSPTP